MDIMGMETTPTAIIKHTVYKKNTTPIILFGNMLNFLSLWHTNKKQTVRVT